MYPCCHLLVDVISVAVCSEVWGKRGGVTQSLDDWIHVTRVAKVTQSRQTTTLKCKITVNILQRRMPLRQKYMNKEVHDFMIDFVIICVGLHVNMCIQKCSHTRAHNWQNIYYDN